jgi:phosphatidylserine/phosphatidylglycerophosphate/cardiolipin synthase-like enzyme
VLQLFQRTQIEKVDSVISSVNFSPNGGCEKQVTSWINKASSSIYVLIYSFTLDSIGNALIDAHNRNISIGIVFEHDNIIESGSEYQDLKNAGIDVRSGTRAGYMHDKIMIVDGKVMLTGSFNWSSNAENEHNENLVVIDGDSVASVFENEFQKIWSSAQ